jgi:outer membrane protein assembly factor BamD
MKIRLLAPVTLVLIAMAFGASARDAGARQQRQRQHKLFDCNKKIAESIVRYNKKRYADVQAALADVKIQCSGHEAMDTIIYYLGMSYMMLKRTDEAKTEFEQLNRDFPNSPFADAARFRVGHCSMIGSHDWERDQTGTRDAIRELTDFVATYPQSAYIDSAHADIVACQDKLAKKELANARFYEKLDQYEAAIVYYRAFLEQFGDTKYAPDAQLAMADNLVKLTRTTEARDVLKTLVDSDASDATKSKAHAMLARIESKSTK